MVAQQRSLGPKQHRRVCSVWAGSASLLAVVAVVGWYGEMVGVNTPEKQLAKVKLLSRQNEAKVELRELQESPFPFRISKCECLKEDGWLASCISDEIGSPNNGTGSHNTTILGNFYTIVSQQVFKLGKPENDHIDIIHVENKIEGKQAQFLYGSFDNETSICNKQNASSQPKIAFVEMTIPQVMMGIFHQFLAGLVPQISFILGLCDGTIPVDSTFFDPKQIQHWVVNQHNWAKSSNPPYIVRVWDRVRPYLAQMCGNELATFEMISSPRDINSTGIDPYPGHKFQWMNDPAHLIVFHNEHFHVLRSAHARLIRRALFGPSTKKASSFSELKVAVIDRQEQKYRNIVYSSSFEPKQSGGQALLKDVATLLNSLPASKGTNYSVVDSYYTNDFGIEGLNQIDMMKDIDLVLWPHGQQQSNIIWLPECAISIDLLGKKQYANVYYVAGIETGHIMGYIYPVKDLFLKHDKNQAGLTNWPVDMGTGGRASIRDKPVQVDFESIARTLPELLLLRSRCLRHGFSSLPVPNITKQHLQFALGTMGDISSSYRDNVD